MFILMPKIMAFCMHIADGCLNQIILKSLSMHRMSTLPDRLYDVLQLFYLVQELINEF